MGDLTFYIIETLLKAVIVLAVIASLAGLATYAERKVLAGMQRRIGPDMVGPVGIAQLLADMIKLFTKEDVVPSNSNRLIFLIAPLVAVTGAFVALSAVPFLPEFQFFGRTIRPIISDVGVGILFVMGASSMAVYGTLLGGLASANKWGLISAARAVVQLLSFEIVNGLAVLPIILLVSSLSLIDINNAQASFCSWFVWKQPVACVLFIMASFIEANRTPFCLTENETELVAGYATEYSGMRFGVFFIAEYAHMITATFLITLLFFGGFNPLWFIPGALAMFLKVSFFFFFFLWTRAAWPHLRPDQLMGFCWKILLPIAIANLLLTGLIVAI